MKTYSRVVKVQGRTSYRIQTKRADELNMYPCVVQHAYASRSEAESAAFAMGYVPVKKWAEAQEEESAR
jgi:hypothetical protein